MGNRLPHGLGGRGHWVDMLGVGEGKVNVWWHKRIVDVTSLLHSLTVRRRKPAAILYLYAALKRRSSTMLPTN